MARHEAQGITASYVLWKTRVPTPRWFDDGQWKHGNGPFWRQSDRLWGWMRSHGLIRMIEHHDTPRRVTTTEDRMVIPILIGIAVFAVAVVVGTGVGIWWVVRGE